MEKKNKESDVELYFWKYLWDIWEKVIALNI